MSQPSILTPSKHTKEQSNPKNASTDIDLSEVITDVVPLFMLHGHANPIRKPITSASRKGNPSKVNTSSSPSMDSSNEKIIKPHSVIKKPHSMTSMYLKPINVEPNVNASAKCHIVQNVVENV